MVERQFVILSLAGVAVGIGLGVIIGYFGRGESYAPVEPPTADPNVNRVIINEISNTNIKENLR